MTRDTTFRRATATLAVAGALGLTACGGDSTEDKNNAFVEDGTNAVGQVENIGTAIGAAVNDAANTSDADLEATFTKLAGRAGEAVKDLDALEPPSDAAQATVDALSTALTKGQKDLENIAAAAKAHDGEAAKNATIALGTDSEAIVTEKDKLEKQIDTVSSEK